LGSPAQPAPRSADFPPAAGR